MNLPINEVLLQSNDYSSNIKYYVNELKDRLNIIHKITEDNIVQSKDIMKEKFDINRRVKENNFKIGNLVYI